MPPVQTTQIYGNPLGAPGMEYDSGRHNRYVSLICAEDIPFGAGVRCANTECELPDSSAEVTVGRCGIAMIDQTKASGVGYKAGEVAKILIEGTAWVNTEDGVAEHGKLFMRFTADTNPKGSFRSDTDSGEAVAVPGFRVFRGNSGAGLAVAEVGLLGVSMPSGA